MNEEYPSEDDLRLIEQWDVAKNGNKSLVEFVASIWHWDEYVTLKGKVFELHTGGWSGNEDIINSLQKNWIFWSMCWDKSEKGGHYYFTLKEVSK